MEKPRQARCRKRNKTFTDAIKRYYGCKNPNCCWQGNHDPTFLEFHHIAGKTNNVHRMLSYSLKAIAEEINRCTVLCANCHRLQHKNPIPDLPLCKVDEFFLAPLLL